MELFQNNEPYVLIESRCTTDIGVKIPPLKYIHYLCLRKNNELSGTFQFYDDRTKRTYLGVKKIEEKLSRDLIIVTVIQLSGHYPVED